eukprot:TCONS_00014511-protein
MPKRKPICFATTLLPLVEFVWRPIKRFPIRTDKTFKFDPVESDEIFKLLQGLKRKKATGIDQLPSNLLKDSAPVIDKPLAHIVIYINISNRVEKSPHSSAGSISSAEIMFR